ncbi:hypothetical protein [Albibacterium profundi]|uniref:Outer membrane protein beta-barrel domain-containing protein n=1 Tax=Albibacterium profundi TaxID=3134906 RepID=A0ABV5CD06_9SPHI
MKKNIFLAFGLFAFFSLNNAFAQFSRPVSVGVGAGGTLSLADLGNSDIRFAGHVDVDGLITPFISVGVHGEKGIMSAYGWNSEFENRYYTINGNVKVRLGQFLSLPKNYSNYTLRASIFNQILANIYVGGGVGLFKSSIENNIDPNYTESISNNGGEVSDDLNSGNLVIPLNIGLDIPLGRTLYGPRWAINLNYQHSLLPKDNLDGVINRKDDQYSYLSLGVKMALFNR